MKKITVLTALAVFSQLIFAQTAPPVPPPPPSPSKAPTVPPPPPPPPSMLADTSKPIKVRTKKIEVIVDNKSEIKTDGTEDVNINAGDKKIIIKRREKGADDNTDVQIGTRKIIIKNDGDKDVTIEEGGKEGKKIERRAEKIIVRKQKNDDGKEEIIIDGAAIDKEMGEIMESIGKEMDELGKEMDKLGSKMDGKGKEMDNIGKEMEKASTPQERDVLNKKMEEKRGEMDVLTKEMDALSKEMDALSKEMKDLEMGDMSEAPQEQHVEKIIIKQDGEESHKHKRAKVKNRFVMFDFGVNGLMQNGSFNLKEDAEPLEVFYGKSFFYRIGAFRQRVPIDYKGHVNLMWGLDVEFDNLEFSRPITLQKNTTPTAIITDNSAEYKLNRLYTSWVDLPISLQFETSRKSSKSFRIGVGGFGGLMLASLQHQNTTDDKEQRVESGFNLNKFRYGAQLTVGSGPINLVARYATSPLFLVDKGPAVNTFSVGVSVIPF